MSNLSEGLQRVHYASHLSHQLFCNASRVCSKLKFKINVPSYGFMPRLWAVTVLAFDLNEAIKFYKDAIGLDLLEDSPSGGMAIFDVGGIPFLIRVPELGEDWKRPSAPASLFIEVDDIQEVSKKIASANGRILFGPEEVSDGQINMGIEDPSGNEIIVTSRPNMTSDSRSQILSPDIAQGSAKPLS